MITVTTMSQPALQPGTQPHALLAPATEDAAVTVAIEVTPGTRPLALRTQHEAHRAVRERAVGWH